MVSLGRPVGGASSIRALAPERHISQARRPAGASSTENRAEARGAGPLWCRRAAPGAAPRRRRNRPRACPAGGGARGNPLSSTLLAAFSSTPVIRPSSVSQTRSTSWPSLVRKWLRVTGISAQPACFRISLTANVSITCPNSVKVVGARASNRLSVIPSRYAASPLSTKCTFGEWVAREDGVGP